MLGIDLVDLDDPLLKYRNERSFRFIAHPQDSFSQGLHDFWYFWTAKEAVFKTKRELTRFAPKNIPIQLLIPDEKENYIRFHSGPQINGRIYREDQVIIAIATKIDPKDITFHYFKQTTYNESKEVREALQSYVSEHLRRDVHVTTNHNGLPQLNHKQLPVSFSHHGRYLAFACPPIS